MFTSCSGLFMDKRVVVFLVLSLAIILGFDLLLKQMGWLPEPPPVQDGSVQTPSSSERESTSDSLERQGQRFDQSERPKPIGSKVWRTCVRVSSTNFGTDGDG